MAELDLAKEELKQQQTTAAAKQKALLSSLENSKSDLKDLREKYSQLDQNLTAKQNELQQASDQFEVER